MPNTVLAVIADTHIGSTTSICPPTFEIHGNRLDEVQIGHANKAQEWLYACWLDYWGYIDTLLDYDGNTRRNKLVVAILGDVVDGIHHGTNQIMPELADQINAANTLLRPIVEGADTTIGIIGTEAHAGNAGDTEWALYRSLGCAHIGHQLTVEIDGVLHDFAHTGRAGYRPWTGSPVSLAVEVGMDCIETGTPMPRYIWRAHTHKIQDTGFQLPNTRVIVCPSWQLKTAYARQKFPNQTRSDIGGMVHHDGRVDWEKARYTALPDQRKIVCLS